MDVGQGKNGVARTKNNGSVLSSLLYRITLMFGGDINLAL